MIRERQDSAEPYGWQSGGHRTCGGEAPGSWPPHWNVYISNISLSISFCVQCRMPVSSHKAVKSSPGSNTRHVSDCRGDMHNDTESEGSSSVVGLANGMEVDAETAGPSSKGVRFDKDVKVHEETCVPLAQGDRGGRLSSVGKKARTTTSTTIRLCKISTSRIRDYGFKLMTSQSEYDRRYQPNWHLSEGHFGQCGCRFQGQGCPRRRSW